ncbi:ClC family H(+)/Cl(-) exchange transporter [Mycobacterium sp. C31M]
MTTPQSAPDSSPGLALICAIAVIAGVAIGFVGGAFRWCLERADTLRGDLVDWAHHLPGPSWLILMCATAAGATLAALIVRSIPLAAGSGIQHVEAVHRGEAAPPLPALLPAKFVGGLLAIGSGLVLGREGPTVHMGAALGAEAARRSHLAEPDVRMLQAALGGAGLAVAFNAPIAGVLFTLEEVTRSFRLRTVLATLFATASAVGCSRLITGDEPDFDVASIAAPSLSWLPLFVVFGLLTGLAGVLYNRLVLGFLDGAARVSRVPPVAKAALIGTVVGLVTFIEPLATGGGDTLNQMILGADSVVLWAVAGFLIVRFVAGPLSYAAAVPGGLFAPLLAIGTLWGVLFLSCFDTVWPGEHTALAVPMAIVGMTAFFGATVRAPLTAIVVVIEMTGTTAVAIPTLAATAAAVLVAESLRSPPIYDSLRQRMPPE